MSRTRKLDELEKRLYAACRGPAGIMPGAGWREAVMDEIRLRGASETGERARAFFVRFAWRFSAAACLVALALLAYMFANGFVDYQDLAMRYLENPIDFII